MYSTAQLVSNMEIKFVNTPDEYKRAKQTENNFTNIIFILDFPQFVINTFVSHSSINIPPMLNRKYIFALIIYLRKYLSYKSLNH